MRYLLALAVLLCGSAQAAEIPPKSIYRSDKVSKALEKNHGMLSQIGREVKGGASNIILVDAKSADDAVRACHSVLTEYRTADSTTEWSENFTGHYWLIVYLGRGGPRKWEVDGVTIDGNRIRFKYHRWKPPKGGYFGNGVVARFFYWVPLGELEPGTYRLELFDGEAVTLMRRVEVGLQVP